MYSPYQQHLGTNHVPSIEEMKNIKDFLGNSVKELDDIDLEIDQLQQRLMLLQEKRSKVYDFVEQHRALITPARRLDRDVLEQIFIACLPADRNPCMSATEAPLLLTRIYSSWRNLAHCTPPLWAAIHIVLPDIYGVLKYPPDEFYSLQKERARLKLEQRQEGTKEWLDRSRGYPLSISLYQPPVRGELVMEANPVERGDEHELHLSFVTSTLIPHIHHWYEIDVHTHPRFFKALIQNGFAVGSMRMLKKIHIIRRHAYNFRGHQEWIEWKDIVGLTPHTIESATVHGLAVSLSDFSSVELYSASQVTELNLSAISVTNEISAANFLFSLIRHCKSLKILKLDIPDGSRGQVARDIEPIVLPNLTTLYIAGAESLETLDFVKSLHLYSLESLDYKISAYSRSFSEVRGTLTALLQRCGGSLQHFGFYTPHCVETASNLAELLTFAPNLRSLKVSLQMADISSDRWVSLIPVPVGWPSYRIFYDLISDDLLDRLSPSGKEYSDIICPKLEALEFDHRILTVISEKALKEFVKARQQAHVSDQRITVLRQLCVSINQFKQISGPEDEKVTLGENSAVYFRKRPKDLSPWGGIGFR